MLNRIFVGLIEGRGRLVSSDDLTEMQIAEAKVRGDFFTDNEGFGYVLLPWSLSAPKDPSIAERDAAVAEVEHWKESRQSALDAGELRGENERLRGALERANEYIKLAVGDYGYGHVTDADRELLDAIKAALAGE